MLPLPLKSSVHFQKRLAARALRVQGRPRQQHLLVASPLKTLGTAKPDLRSLPVVPTDRSPRSLLLTQHPPVVVGRAAEQSPALQITAASLSPQGSPARLPYPRPDIAFRRHRPAVSARSPQSGCHPFAS